jgi:hypothetical protein
MMETHIGGSTILFLPRPVLTFPLLSSRNRSHRIVALHCPLVTRIHIVPNTPQRQFSSTIDKGHFTKGHRDTLKTGEIPQLFPLSLPMGK